MKRSFLLSLAVTAAASVVAATSLRADDKPKSPPIPDAAAMKRWQECCTPGENHAWLGRFVGSWDSVTKIWMAPGAPPAESKGTSENKWLVDGRWLMSSSTGSMMGQPYSATGIMGYDNFRKKYVMTYVDSMTTAMLASEGHRTQDGETLISYGPMDEPLNGEVEKPVKYVWRFHGPDKHVFEIHDLAIGESNTKVIEATYTRRK